jgi:hypothetical protein
MAYCTFTLCPLFKQYLISASLYEWHNFGSWMKKHWQLHTSSCAICCTIRTTYCTVLTTYCTVLTTYCTVLTTYCTVLTSYCTVSISPQPVEELNGGCLWNYVLRYGTLQNLFSAESRVVVLFFLEPNQLRKLLQYRFLSTLDPFSGTYFESR